MARLADRLAPGAPADYTVAAPGRWGGPLTGPGVHARRAEEQALVLAAAGGASVPLLRQGVPGGEALAVAPAAYHNPPSLAPILAAAQPEGAADEVAQPEAAGWQPSEADAPAAEAIRRVASCARVSAACTAACSRVPPCTACRQLPPVHAFALDAASVARAAARAARGFAPAPPGDTFAMLPGRAGRQALPYDRDRLDNILARDPHSKELLETINDLLA